MDINKSCPLLSSLEILACVHTLFLGRGSPSAFFLFQVIVMGNTDYLFSWLSVNF